MWSNLFFAICLFFGWQLVEPANILYISTTASPSHNIWDRTLAVALSERHKITFLTPTSQKGHDNLTILLTEGVYEKLEEGFDIGEIPTFTPYQTIVGIYTWVGLSCRSMLGTSGLKTLVQQAEDGVSYDLIIMDLTSGQCLYPLVEKFKNPPMIATSPFGLQPYFSSSFGTDVYPSYIPMCVVSYTEDMTFLERMYNTFYTLFMVYYRQYVSLPEQYEMAKKYFGNDIKPFNEVEKNIVLLLSNSDPVLDYPHPVPPNIIHVGGLHTKREIGLPKDLKKNMDDAKHGVILFSLGSNFRSDKLKPETKQALIKALGELKQTVLWKYESDISNLPKNIIVSKWLPQNDILAHPNIKLFISHGGGLSTQEAMYHGVPIIGIPFGADQIVNMEKLMSRKVAVTLDLSTLTYDDISKALDEVLNNPEYTVNMRTLSIRYRDQPESALERALFWVEHTLRNKGAKYLSPASRTIPFYRYYQLDLLLVIAGIFHVIVFSVCKLIGCLKKSKANKEKTN